MVDIPVMYVVFVEGDTSEPDYIGVTKSITPIGAEYRIVGPLANAMKKAEDNLIDAYHRAYGEVLNIRAEVPDGFLFVADDGTGIETYEAVRDMAKEIERLRKQVSALGADAAAARRAVRNLRGEVK